MKGTTRSPIKHGLLKLTVSGVGSGTIQSVTLRLFCLDASDKGGDFYWVPETPGRRTP